MQVTYLTIEPRQDVQVYLLVYQPVSDSEAYKKSLEIEPRQAS